MSTSQPRTKVLIDTHELDQQLRSAPHSLPVFRSVLEAARSCVAQQFRVGVSAPSLVHGYAQCIDQLLSRIWQQFELQLGDGNALVVLPRHGFVLTGTSLSGLAGRAASVRANSIIQQMAVALRGEVAYLDDPTPPPDPAAEPLEDPGPGPTFPEGETAGGGRGWVYWMQTTSLD